MISFLCGIIGIKLERIAVLVMLWLWIWCRLGLH